MTTFGNIKTKFIQILVGIIVVVFITLIANAFTEPSLTPPGGNVSAPLNTSATTQTKTGKLLFPWFEDSDSLGYYVDPGGTSWLTRLYSFDIRSDIFFDRNNTVYFVDPASETAASLAGEIKIDGNTVIDNGAGWHRTYGQTGWYNGTYDGGWHMTDTTWVRSYNNKSVYTGGQVRGDAGLCIGTDCRTSWPSSSAESDPIFNQSKGINVYSCPVIWVGNLFESTCVGQLSASAFCQYSVPQGDWPTVSCSFVGRLVQ